MDNFTGFGLPPALQTALARMNYVTPTPIQAQAIPLALKGHDILGSAQTGTGKTAAFGIPLVAKLLGSPRGSALVMTPTRELAVQVLAVLQDLTKGMAGMNSVLLIGGEPMPKQMQQLRMRPRIIVGTPGRINDHLERGTLMLHEANFLVLDETDRMLDMGFGVQIDRVLKFMPPVRQTLLFSATLPDGIIGISKKYLKNPERVAIGSTTKVADAIEQEVVHTTEANKYNALMTELEKRTGSIIIFVRTKHGADRMADKLRKNGQSAEAIHGDLHQRKRERVINAFREMKHRILVATDIAARGLDIKHIEHVINYDLPQCPEDYIHRIGRTARNGAEGAAVCLLAPSDGVKWHAIQRLLNPGAARTQFPKQEGGHRPHGNGNGNGKPNEQQRRRRNRTRTRRFPQRKAA